MKNKKIVFYSIYKEDNNDLQLISQLDNLDSIADYLNIKKASLKVMISKRQKIKDKYIIFKDYITEQELTY